MQSGDVILKVGSTPVNDANDRIEAVSGQSIGAKVPIACGAKASDERPKPRFREVGARPAG
jgi:S1-C subfamily serine protease